MNSPYMGNFKVTQQYKGANHDGFDLVGLDSKEVHSTVNGIVTYAGWENNSNHKQGFGQYVKIKDNKTGYYFYFGHLSSIKVRVGQNVKITDVIGIEGNTGYSTGSHCHYCIRKNGKGTHIDVSEHSGIPNNLGTYNDGYVQKNNTALKVLETSGYKKGDNTIGSLSLKKLLNLSKVVGLNKYSVSDGNKVDDGTINAINYILGTWGYKQNGIAGSKFINKLYTEITARW